MGLLRCRACAGYSRRCGGFIRIDRLLAEQARLEDMADAYDPADSDDRRAGQALSAIAPVPDVGHVVERRHSSRRCHRYGKGIIGGRLATQPIQCRNRYQRGDYHLPRQWTGTGSAPRYLQECCVWASARDKWAK